MDSLMPFFYAITIFASATVYLRRYAAPLKALDYAIQITTFSVMVVLPVVYVIYFFLLRYFLLKIERHGTVLGALMLLFSSVAAVLKARKLKRPTSGKAKTRYACVPAVLIK
jgi:hypothetical protein